MSMATFGWLLSKLRTRSKSARLSTSRVAWPTRGKEWLLYGALIRGFILTLRALFDLVNDPWIYNWAWTQNGSSTANILVRQNLWYVTFLHYLSELNDYKILFGLSVGLNWSREEQRIHVDRVSGQTWPGVYYTTSADRFVLETDLWIWRHRSGAGCRWFLPWWRIFWYGEICAIWQQ